MLHALITRDKAPAHSLSLLLAAETAWRGEGLDKVAGLVALGWDEGRLLDAAVDLWAVGQGVGALGAAISSTAPAPSPTYCSSAPTRAARWRCSYWAAPTEGGSIHVSDG